VAESADREDDQARVELVQALHREAEAVKDAGAEVLEEDICLGDEALEEALALGGLEVRGHRLLVAIAGQVVGRDGGVFWPDEGRAPPAGLITASRRLDLDDPRPEVAQHHPAVGTRQGAGQIDDDDVGQWPRNTHTARVCRPLAACVGRC